MATLLWMSYSKCHPNHHKQPRGENRGRHIETYSGCSPRMLAPSLLSGGGGGERERNKRRGRRRRRRPLQSLDGRPSLCLSVTLSGGGGGGKRQYSSFESPANNAFPESEKTAPSGYVSQARKLEDEEAKQVGPQYGPRAADGRPSPNL